MLATTKKFSNHALQRCYNNCFFFKYGVLKYYNFSLWNPNLNFHGFNFQTQEH